MQYPGLKVWEGSVPVKETVPIKLKNCICLKKKKTKNHYPFLVQYILVSAVTYTALPKGQLSVRIETLSVLKVLAFLSCFFGTAMPYLFQTVLPPSTVTTTFPESQHISDTASGKGYSWLWLAAQSSLADGPMSGASCSESRATPRGSNRCGSGRPLFHFPVHGSGNCSESTYLIGVKTSRQDCKVPVSSLKETLQKLLQYMVCVWFLKPEVFCLTFMKNFCYQNAFYS